ncbi:MAG TPA: Sec-independent protein translocase protein TatB [Pseudoxanthomonas sp.]
MFDIGFSELLVVAIVALIVLGPERLPKATRFAGLWVRRARAQWYSVKDELERDLAADELKRSLRDADTTLRDAGQAVRDSGEEARREFDELRAAAKSEVRSIEAMKAEGEGKNDEPRQP